MNKILTIVIPTYNMEKYLDKCLTSLIVDNTRLQGLLEVLVINDGSKDHSSEIAHKYKDAYPNIFCVIDKENGNYGSCINRGLKEATGKYIKVLDADDHFDTLAFEGYMQKLTETDADLVLNDTVFINQNNIETENIPFASTFKANCVHRFEEFLSIKDLYKLVAMHCVAYKTENLRAIGYHQTEGISYTDVEWTFTPMTKVESFVTYPYNLYRYLYGREGQTMDPKVRIKKRGELATMIKSLFMRKNNYPHFDCYEKYLLTILEMRAYEFYHRFYYDRKNVDEMVELDSYIKKNAPKTYKESFDYKSYWSDDIRYIYMLRSPWKSVFHSLYKDGIHEAIKQFNKAHELALLKPRILASIINRTII